MGITFLINEERCSHVVSIPFRRYNRVKRDHKGQGVERDGIRSETRTSRRAIRMIAATYRHKRPSFFDLFSHFVPLPFLFIFPPPPASVSPRLGRQTRFLRGRGKIYYRSGREVEALSSNLFRRIDSTPSATRATPLSIIPRGNVYPFYFSSHRHRVPRNSTAADASFRFVPSLYAQHGI